MTPLQTIIGVFFSAMLISFVIGFIVGMHAVKKPGK